MTYRQRFSKMINERRAFERGSLDWQYRTNAARKYLKMSRGLLPTNEV